MHAESICPIQLLQFYADIGVDENICMETFDRTNMPEVKVVLPLPQAQQAEKVPAAVVGAVEALAEARTAAAGAQTIEELKKAIEEFEGLSIKRTATQIVFADGNPKARVMFIGDAPGADEDRNGRPFAGAHGQLLDRMLAAIGLSREENAYISNVVNWRPPGNRKVSETEIALSLPFIQRHIELVNPAVIVYVGDVSAKALRQTPLTIARIRGKWADYQSDNLKEPIPSLPLFHPEYLLRSPAQKALAWADLLSLKKKLKYLNVL